jgi:Protein of unknown function (DUF3768)
MNKTIKIRALNDALRAIAAGNGRIYVTAGIAALPMQDQVEIMSRVREFADFTADNDPYGQHDFGSFEYSGKKIFWKIDYYDRQLEFGSPDPSDESVTTRVLTVLLAEEY